MFTLELGHKPQDDYTFNIAGSMGPITSSRLECEKMEEAESDCPLQAEFSVLNIWDGVISPKVYLETWQIGAEVDMTFDMHISVSSVWGAEVVSEDVMPRSAAAQGDRQHQTIRFRLIPIARGLPPERRSAFGFEATPVFHSNPTISCTLKKALPPPPPPSPPFPYPPPPMRKLIDEHDCFLGGRMFFTKPPTTVGVPWRFDVALDNWYPDVLLTLNFFGDTWTLKGHPLQIESIDPEESMWLAEITSHSVTYRTRPVPSGDPGAIQIVAYGMIEGIARVTCCCAPPPPPPPTAPNSPGPRPPPPPSPHPPPPPPYFHVDGDLASIAGTKQNVLAFPPPSPASTLSSSTEYTWLGVAAFGALVLGAKRLRKKLRFALLYWKTHRGLGKHRLVAPGDDDDDEVVVGHVEHEAAAEAEDEDGDEVDGNVHRWGGRPVKGVEMAAVDEEAEDTLVVEEAPARQRENARSAPKSRNAAKPRKPRSNGRAPGKRTGASSARLLVEVPDGSEHEVDVDVSGAESMQALQVLVMEHWVGLGGKRHDGLMMEFKLEQHDDFAKVTRSTTIETLRAARELRLQAKHSSHGTRHEPSTRRQKLETLDEDAEAEEDVEGAAPQSGRMCGPTSARTRTTRL